MTRKFAYKLAQRLINVLAATLVFVSMPFCFFTVGAAYHTGGWEPLRWTVISLAGSVVCSSVLTLLFPYFLKRKIKKVVSPTAQRHLQKKTKVTLRWLNTVSWLGLLVFGLVTLANENGLWQYASYHDRYFSNSVIDYHFFPPIFGLWGIYLVLVAYYSCWATCYVTLSADRTKSFWTAWTRLLFFLPVATYYGLVWTHQFIPKQRFIG